MTDTETNTNTKTNLIHHILEDILYHKISRIPPIIYFLNSMKSLSQERKLHNLVDYDDDWNSNPYENFPESLVRILHPNLHENHAKIFCMFFV